VAGVIVLDASILIAHLTPGDPHADAALDVLDTEEELAMHALTVAECLVHPARLGRENEVVRIIERIGIGTLPFRDDASLRLARLRAQTGLRMPDACVLGAALETGADLATFDDRLARIARDRGITVVTAPA